jgi:DNA-binding HxlR family transcriptional regulator
MLGKTYDSQVCSAARALELVGERWSLLIIRNALFAGATRFNDFLTLGIATNILKTRLDGFVDAGIMERRSTPEAPEHFDYVLTDKGRELAPVIVALTEWGDLACQSTWRNASAVGRRQQAPDSFAVLRSRRGPGGRQIGPSTSGVHLSEQARRSSRFRRSPRLEPDGTARPRRFGAQVKGQGSQLAVTRDP